MTLAQVVVLALMALLLVGFLLIMLAPVWYPAAVFYHSIFERESYLRFRQALGQAKDLASQNERIPIFSLTYWIYSGQHDKYLDELKRRFCFIVMEDGPSLYQGTNIVLTQFSKPLIKRLIKMSGYKDKVLSVLHCIEIDATRLGPSEFIDKYIGTHADVCEMTQTEFCNKYIEAKRIELGMNKSGQQEEVPAEAQHNEPEPENVSDSNTEEKPQEEVPVEVPVEAKKTPEEKPKHKTTAKKAPAKKTAKKSTKKSEVKA